MDQQTVARFQRHFLTAMAAVGGGGRHVRLAGAEVVANPRSASPAFNFILLKEGPVEALDAVIGQGSALLAQYGRLPAIYLTSSDEAWAEALRGRGWRRQMQGVALGRPLPAEEWVPVPAGLTIEAVGPDRLNHWLDVLTEGYEAPPHVALQIRAAWATLMKNSGSDGTARYFLAFMNGEAAGTGLLWIHGETAGLYCGAVRPRWRRRGIGAALLAHRLSEATRLGATAVTTQTEVGSPVERVTVDRLHFTTAFPLELWLPPLGR